MQRRKVLNSGEISKRIDSIQSLELALSSPNANNHTSNRY